MANQKVAKKTQTNKVKFLKGKNNNNNNNKTSPKKNNRINNISNNKNIQKISSNPAISLLETIFQIYPSLTIDEMYTRFKDLFPNNNDFKKITKPKLTFGQRLSDSLTKWAGSWTFISSFGVFLVIWMIINSWYLINRAWDPYPYILLNLVLSCLAAIQAPVILMSQNRATERDRHKAELDYMVNRKAEREIAKLMKEVKSIKYKISSKK